MVKRILVVVPMPMDEAGLAKRRAQLDEVVTLPGVEFHYRAARAGPGALVAAHDLMFMELGVIEAAVDAEREGFDAVSIDSLSDSGMGVLRSMLDIPVIGAGRASIMTALMLGDRFSVLVMHPSWAPIHRKIAAEVGVKDRLASIRSIDVEPDHVNLLGGKEEIVLPKLAAAARQCVEEDGADVVMLGSTTMYEAGAYLARHCPVPVVNPAPVALTMAQSFVALGLSNSRAAYPKTPKPMPRAIHAMVDGMLIALKA